MNIKQLLAGIVFIIIIGLVGFWYRGFLERSATGNGTVATTSVAVTEATSTQQACTAEAKICPDGSAVGRTGANCTFAVCPLPNVEVSAASSTVAFVLPSGFTKVQQGSQNPNTLAAYQKPTGTAGTYHTLTLSAFPIGAGETGRSVMLANTVFDPSGMQATSTDMFKTITAGKNTFYEVTIGRFEGQVESAYYLVTDTTVYRFDLIERNVQNWTDPKLVVDTLPAHQAVNQMLSTVQVSPR